VFASTGSYASPQEYTDGMTSAVWVGAAVLAVGAVAALFVPGRRPRRESTAGELAPAAA
jgi:hypothetical protein